MLTKDDSELPFPEWQARVITEKVELDQRHHDLILFRRTYEFGQLSWDEQERINTQCHLMTMYSAVLAMRIEAFSRPVDLGREETTHE